MKRFHAVIAAALRTVLLVGVAVPVAADTEVRIVPLSWKHVSSSDGSELYANLCASCHGMNGKGAGPAAPAVDKGVPDLTVLCLRDGGMYSREELTHAIFGEDRTVSHRGLDMPAWGEQFQYAGRGWHNFPRRKLANDRIEALAVHVESMQVQ